MKRQLILLIFSIISISSVQAQRTEIYLEPDRPYKTAVELMEKEKYGAARELFEQYIQQGNGSPLNRVNAGYYVAICAYELFHPDAEGLLKDFTEKYPESTKAPMATFHLGRHYYRIKQYASALKAFEKTDINYLNQTELPEYYFKIGYCQFSKGESETASKSFHEILNVPSKYQTAAQYYYGHIAYSNNNFKTAIEYFSKLDSSATFGPLVPYYITSIYFEQGKYDDVVRYGIPALQRNPQNNADITRMIAEAYYRKGNYSDAITYFDGYASVVPVMSREDHYTRAFCLYKTGRTAEAIDAFKLVTDGNDTLAQNAYYHLADCFLAQKDQQAARNAFQSAAGISGNASIRELAQFNYAKLSFELNYQPVAIQAFRDFIKNYPTSSNADEANELLARLYLTTRNYKDALIALEQIKNKNTRAKEAYQKVAYFRGVEHFNDGEKEKAIGMFEKAIVNDVDPNIKAKAIYWKAEVLYAQGKYDAAIKQYRIFIFNPSSVNVSMYNLANYNMGYAYFRQSNYKDAQTWFRKYLAKRSNEETAQYEDALVRTADCYYAMRDFSPAVNYYNDAITEKASSADYCLFQKGLIEGLQGDLTAKSASMQKLLTTYPDSKYRADALFEKGKAQVSLNNESEALGLFAQLEKEFPNSNYVKKAVLNTGLIHYNNKQDEKALASFKRVIQRYPGTPEAAEALASVKNIYIANGKPNDYFDFVKTIPNASVSSGAQDSITYEAAEQRYLKGNFEDASGDFDRYLQQFPSGAYRLNATFYKAECDFRNGQESAALAGYERILAEPHNLFTEKSLLKAATLNVKQKNYQAAIDQFIKLEQGAEMRDNILAAQTGLMRAYAATGNNEACISYAQKIIAAEKVSNEVMTEAHLLYARAAMQNADYVTAKKEFTVLSKQSSQAGAEAKFNLALIEYKMGNFKTSQNTCFNVINQVPSYDFWIAKSFVLLADNYLALKDTFQAKETLKSIIGNYEKSPADPEDIRQTAQEKLDAISRMETLPLKPEDQPEQETDINKEQK